jgi:hypothetical protein
MRSFTPARGLILGRAAAVALGIAISMPYPVTAQSSFLQNGTAGFVVSEIKYALADDAAKTGACPKGMSLNAAEIFAQTPQGKRKKGETDEQYAHRLNEGAKELSTAPNGQNLCMNPEAGGPDPYFRTVAADNVPVDGIDLDGIDSSAASPSSGRRGPQHDFSGPHGERGVDNQFYRVVGCSRSWQSSGLSNGFTTETMTMWRSVSTPMPIRLP